MKTEPKPELSPELIQKAQAGDQGAMTALYEATHQELYRTVHAMVRDEDLTLDIQQDAYVQAFSHLDQLREPENFLPWLRQIAVNRTRSLMRKRTPLLFSQLELGDADEGLEIPDLSPENSPELALDRKETNRLIREILGELSDAQRMLVGMYYYEQIPVGKIAEDLGISPGSVKTQLFRSRKTLESRIRQLESQGVKLFGLSPMPFLLGLLKKAEPPAAAEGKALAGVLTQSAASTASTAVKAVAVHTGRSFFQTALGRVTLGVLAAAALGGGILGYGRIKDKLLIGDYQPPTPVESDENLSTEPSETVKYEIPEDLSTEPITTEPVTTEPTESGTTGPTESHTTEPTEPTTPNNPVNPTDPSNPGTPDPGGAGSDPAPQPTDPAPRPSDPTEPEPTSQGQPNRGFIVESWEVSYPWQQYVYGYGLQSGTIRDIPYYSDSSLGFKIDFHLNKMPSGNELPAVSSDNPRVAEFTHAIGITGSHDGCMCYFESYGPGTAHITVNFGGGQVVRFTVINPEYPEKVIQTKSSVGTRNGSLNAENRGFEDCYPQSYWEIRVIVQGFSKPELTTDNPSVFQPKELEGFSSGETDWIRQGWRATGNLVGAGDAHIYLKLNGKIVYTWTVHAYDDAPTPTEPTPTEPPPTEPAPTESKPAQGPGRTAGNTVPLHPGQQIFENRRGKEI